MSELNIVDLIENNPIARLTNTYQNKLLSKIKDNFNDTEQQLFISSFYCYLNHNKTDFIIDLDNVWSWLGFSQTDAAKRVLEKNFKLDIDYKIFAPQVGGAKELLEKNFKNLVVEGSSPSSSVLFFCTFFKCKKIKKRYAPHHRI